MSQRKAEKVVACQGRKPCPADRWPRAASHLFSPCSPWAWLWRPLASGARAAEAAAAAAGGGTAVEEVIVTAQKREQRLQDVPVAVTVLNTRQLEQAGVRSVKDLTLLTPGLNATTNADEATTTVRIRGIGTVADNAGLEDAVGIYIDGVYRPRNGVSFNNLGELSDVEVLKGPQGTLFGKNTVAGVIQITTKRPSFTFGGEAEANVQNYGGYGGSISVTGPLIKDMLAARLYVADTQRDGYVPVVSPNPQPAQFDEHVFTTREQLLYQPNADFSFNIIGDYTKRDDHCCAPVDYLNGFPAVLQNEIFPGTIPAPVSPKNNTAYLNVPSLEHIREGGVSGEANWTTPWFGGAKLTSITAWRDWRDHASTDSDYTTADFLVSPQTNYQEFEQFSEELRYNGEAGRLSWQVGGFYGHENLDFVNVLNFGADLTPYVAILTAGAGPFATGTYNPPGGTFPAGAGTFDTYHQTEDSEAIYTQDDFRITSQLTFTGGIRYTSEHKSLTSLYDSNDSSGTCAHFEGVAAALGVPQIKAFIGTHCLINPAFKGLTTHQSFTEGAVTGTAKLTFKFNDENMVYGSYSRGNLVGGFNLAEVTTAVGVNPNASLTPQTDTTVPAESVDAYEIGAKSQLFNRRLLLSAALFYQDYSNFQLNAFTGTQFIEQTIPEARSEGVEIEAYGSPIRDLTLNAGVTYANTYYPNSARNQAALGNSTVGSPLYETTPLFRLPGGRLSFAPVWSVVGGVFYKHALFGPLDWTASADGKYQSSYNTGSDHDPVKLQKGFAIFNARVGIATHDGRWTLEAWATNLFNQFYGQAKFDGVIQTFSAPQPSSEPALNNYYSFPGQPRFFGATLRVKY